MSGSGTAGAAVFLSVVSLACGGQGAANATVPAAVKTGHEQPTGDGEGITVDAVTLSEKELAAQPPGQSDPGRASAPAGGSEPGTRQRSRQPQKLVEYRNGRYGFSLRHRADFRLDAVPAKKLARLEPRPDAAIVVRRRVGVDPPDLELRVHRAPRTTRLRQWLSANGLLPSGGSSRVEPFKTAGLSGLQVCGSTLIGPGCSYYFHKGGWVYQLTPASLAGERIVRTLRTT